MVQEDGGRGVDGGGAVEDEGAGQARVEHADAARDRDGVRQVTDRVRQHDRRNRHSPAEPADESGGGAIRNLQNAAIAALLAGLAVKGVIIVGNSATPGSAASVAVLFSPDLGDALSRSSHDRVIHSSGRGSAAG